MTTQLKNESLSFVPLASGLKVDLENGILYGAQVAMAGEALGHGFDLDEVTLDQIVSLGNAEPKGVKVRFGHPNACTPALGTTIGIRKNFSRDGNYVRADLHITRAANPEYARHIFAMAEEHPEKLGNSVVVDGETELRRDERGRPLKDERGHTLPPVLRVKRLRAVDVVDEPAAGDGMFSEPVEGVDLSARTILELRDALDKPGFLERAKNFLSGRGNVSPAVTEAEADVDEVGEPKEAAMSELTLKDFKAKHPEVAQAHAAELSAGHAEALASAEAKGVESERSRITKVLLRAKPHHFEKTKVHPGGFVAHVLSEGLSYEEALEGLMDLDAKAGEMQALLDASADLPVEGAPAPSGESQLSAAEVIDRNFAEAAKRFNEKGGA